MKQILLALCLAPIFAGCSKNLEEQNTALTKALLDTKAAAASASASSTARIKDLESKLAEQARITEQLRAQIESAKPAPAYELTGEVFITNLAGETFRMSGQAVRVYEPKAAKEHLTKWLQSGNEQSEILVAKMKEARGMAEEASKQESYLRETFPTARYDTKHPKHAESEAAFDLYLKYSKIETDAAEELQKITDCQTLVSDTGRPDFVTQTNASGQFKIKLPRNPFVLITQGYWRGKLVVWCTLVTPDAGDNIELILSSQNLANFRNIERLSESL